MHHFSNVGINYTNKLRLTVVVSPLTSNYTKKLKLTVVVSPPVVVSPLIRVKRPFALGQHGPSG